jgi:hypothetical protein
MRNKPTLTKVAEAIGSTVGVIVAKADTAKNALTREIKKRGSSAPVKRTRRKVRKAAAKVRKSAKRARARATR